MPRPHEKDENRKRLEVCKISPYLSKYHCNWPLRRLYEAFLRVIYITISCGGVAWTMIPSVWRLRFFRVATAPLGRACWPDKLGDRYPAMGVRKTIPLWASRCYRLAPIISWFDRPFPGNPCISSLPMEQMLPLSHLTTARQAWNVHLVHYKCILFWVFSMNGVGLSWSTWAWNQISLKVHEIW